MMRIYTILFFLFCINYSTSAQSDTVSKNIDSVEIISLIDSNRLKLSDFKIDTAKRQTNASTLQKESPNKAEADIIVSKEGLFYYLLLLLFVFGMLLRGFNKYFNELFQYFFRGSIRHREARDHLRLSALPSFLMNLFFLLSVGLYVSFQLTYFGRVIHNNFWQQYFICSGLLGLIYLIKFTGLKIAAWLFDAKKIVDTYVFVVFGLNKILGIVILPVLVALAFGNNLFFNIVLNLSWIGIAAFYTFRIIHSYIVAQKGFRLQPVHFLLYAVSFEILPLLIAAKFLNTTF